MELSDTEENEIEEMDDGRPFVFEYAKPDEFIITKEWVVDNGLTRHGWIEEQLEIIGISWPTKPGWLSGLVGKIISNQKKLDFEKFDKKPFFSKFPKTVKKKKVRKKRITNSMEDYVKYKYEAHKIVKRKGKEIKLNPFGYKLIEVEGKIELEHWYVSQMHDGIIPSGYHVHHCDMNKLNNKIENLVQIPGKLHGLIHSTLKNVKKLMPTKAEILSIHLPEFLKGSNHSLVKIRNDHLAFRRENRKLRSSERIKNNAKTILIKQNHPTFNSSNANCSYL